MEKSLPQMHVHIWTILELPPGSGGCPMALHRCRLSPVLWQPWEAQGGPRFGAELSVCPHAGTAVGLQGSGGFGSAETAEVMPGLHQVCHDRMTLQKCFDQSWAKGVYSCHALCCEALSLAPGNRKTCHGRKSRGAGSLPMQALGRRESFAMHSTVF